MSDATPQPTSPAGWYAEPTTGDTRWWDGDRWGSYAPPPQSQPQPQPYAAQLGPMPAQRPLKDVGVAYLLAVLLGGFGAHNFYVGNVGPAVCQLLLVVIGWATSWLFVGFLLLAAWFAWWVVDLFLLPGFVRSANARIATSR